MSIIRLNKVDSTNTFLKELSKTHTLENGTVVITDRQTSGRGQQDTKWISEAGKNLTFSYYQILNLVAEQRFFINMYVCLVLYDVLSYFGLRGLSVKWPNDILVNDKKIAGVLIETSLQKSVIKNAVVGIGLNVNQQTFLGLPNATSMYLETQKKNDLEHVLNTFKKRLEQQPFPKSVIKTEIKKNYEDLLYKKGKKHNFKTTDTFCFSGFVLGVDDLGHLLVEIDGQIKAFANKEIIF